MLIFDEVITGFRFGYHGYDTVVGIEPDLTTLGKIVGGGLPVAAVLGRKDLLSLLAPLGPVYQAGTMAGNPVCLAAGVATLTELAEGGAYRHIEMLGRHLDAAYSRHALSSWRRYAHRSDVWPTRPQGSADGRGFGHLGHAERYHPVMSGWRGALPAPRSTEVCFLRRSHHRGYRERATCWQTRVIDRCDMVASAPSSSCSAWDASPPRRWFSGAILCVRRCSATRRWNALAGA